MLREQPPSLLGQTAAQRSVEEKERDDQELLKLRLIEFKNRQSKIKKYQGARYVVYILAFFVDKLPTFILTSLISLGIPISVVHLL
jgi:flagellar biosynthesis component FlhA